MKQFRYDTTGRWFKGNTHIHSTASDGGKTFSEIAELYAGADYDFLFRTDHWVASDVEQDKTSYPLLWLDGIELDGQDTSGAWYHVVCLGTVTDIQREAGFIAGMESAREQGAIIIAAHPQWCGNSLDDCLRWPFDGVEIYNHVCRYLNGKSDGMVHWDAMLRDNPNTLAFAVDDSHLKPEHDSWNGGWIVVNTTSCTREAVTTAIRSGNFYASCGPEIQSITLTGDELCVNTSPVRYIRLVGPGSNGKRAGSQEGPTITQFTTTVPESWNYAYIELEDTSGKRARTNNLFITS